MGVEMNRFWFGIAVWVCLGLFSQPAKAGDCKSCQFYDEDGFIKAACEPKAGGYCEMNYYNVCDGEMPSGGYLGFPTEGRDFLGRINKLAQRKFKNCRFELLESKAMAQANSGEKVYLRIGVNGR